MDLVKLWTCIEHVNKLLVDDTFLYMFCKHFLHLYVPGKCNLCAFCSLYTDVAWWLTLKSFCIDRYDVSYYKSLIRYECKNIQINARMGCFLYQIADYLIDWDLFRIPESNTLYLHCMLHQTVSNETNMIIQGEAINSHESTMAFWRLTRLYLSEIYM